SSDYMATRLVKMGRELKGAPDGSIAPGAEDAVDEWPGALPKVVADQHYQDLRAQGLGQAGQGGVTVYDRTLPDDGGVAEATAQPKDVERFGAALFSWNGGSNYADNPT